MSVIEPAPWWPWIGMLLIFEMSTLDAGRAGGVDAGRAVCRLWPHSRPVTVGSRPEADRNSIVAEDRRSIRPAWMSRRPQA